MSGGPTNRMPPGERGWVIERYAEPLAGGRAQMHQAVFVAGEQVPELSHPVGSPAPAGVVRRHEETRRG
jgi:hypothetical protein